jgi:signal transduction histidine kinase
MIRLADGLRNLPCGTIVCSAIPSYPVIDLNDHAARWLKEGTAAIGRPLADIAPLSAAWQEKLALAVAGRPGMIPQETLQWTDGRTRTLTLLVAPVPDTLTHGTAAVLTVLVEDVTMAPPKRKAGVPLQYLEETIDAMPVPLWLFDPQGRVRYVNAHVLRLFDVADFEALVGMIGQTVTEHVRRLRPRMTSVATIATVTENSLTSRAVEQLIAEGASGAWVSDRRREEAEELLQGELAISRALNRRPSFGQVLSMVHPVREVEIIVHASAAPIFNERRRLVGAVLVTIDVTEDLLTQGQRDAMLALAGHEIRNPLTPIKLGVQQLWRRLQREGGGEAIIAELDKILENVQRVQQVANDLDAVAVQGRKSESVIFMSCDLIAVSREVAERQMVRQPENRVIVQANADAIVGNWGRKHLDRVLAMLVASAGRRSPPGKPIAIRLTQGRGQVKVRVIDQGSPMPPEQLAAIQQALRWGSAALAHTEGSDLDLSIVQTILGLYRGCLFVADGPRRGTTFWFSLPLPPPLSEEGARIKLP